MHPFFIAFEMNLTQVVLAGMFYPSDYDINNTTAFVGNVNTDITEEDLWSVFKRCGEILSVKLLKAKGCAFITYANRDAAERAINHLHGRVKISPSELI